ncbi:hypothetical protein N7510_001182 [Penicillium lagena]|uniref:uncharacterized protein n=1 Tax=Penicillium lagena TaxID=94218 RepID=UPI0025400409|nr:uncharacterized protein N7510_001182 [Penicillium lagena]KAJ5624873.1 hypothetical protein N7510_001182 [Penicillium lagena]
MSVSNFPDANLKMGVPKTTIEIERELLLWLRDTPYACSSLETLSGGSSNFVFRARLFRSLREGTRDVVIKHGEGHMAVAPESKISIDRIQIETECLRLLASFQFTLHHERALQFIIKTPRCYLYHERTNNQILEYIPGAINLKQYSLKNFLSPTAESLRSKCHWLGKALAQYITAFHNGVPQGLKERKFLATLQLNQDMQNLKHMINYDWLLQRIEDFPHILNGARDIFVQVKEMAQKELENSSPRLVPIHGDFWTGNVLLEDVPLDGEKETAIFVVDWEMAQLGVPALDHGEMIGEMYALWLYKQIDAGLWMMQGYAEGLGEQTESRAWRTILQVGCHLLSFGTISPGWGTSEQIEKVATLGKEIIVNSWRKDYEWIHNSELACLFAHVQHSLETVGEARAPI